MKQNAGLDEAKTGIRLLEEISTNFIYANNTTLMAEREEELKSFLMRVKGESERAGLKLNIKKKKKKKKKDNGIQPYYFMANRRESGNSDRFPLLGL